MIGDLRFHCRSDAERLVNSAEVVPSHEEVNGSSHMRNALAESIGQAREPAHLHPHGASESEAHWPSLFLDTTFQLAVISRLTEAKNLAPRDPPRLPTDASCLQIATSDKSVHR